jgi:ribosomal protein S18 acetylase RimI-like enzyme
MPESSNQEDRADALGIAHEAALIRRLQPSDARAYQAVRLRGLRECPGAFAASPEEEADEPLGDIARRLEHRPDGAMFGAVASAAVIGIIGIQRESFRKMAHKAFLWGVYVVPEARRHGLARAMLNHGLHYAAHELGVRQLSLGVNTRNVPAIALYRSLGFEVFGTERDFMRVGIEWQDEHHMVVRLDS